MAVTAPSDVVADLADVVVYDNLRVALMISMQLIRKPSAVEAAGFTAVETSPEMGSLTTLPRTRGKGPRSHSYNQPVIEGKRGWSGRRDSNPRPPTWRAAFHGLARIS